MWACCAFVLPRMSVRDSENIGLGIAVAGLWLWGCASNGMILSRLTPDPFAEFGIFLSYLPEQPRILYLVSKTL